MAALLKDLREGDEILVTKFNRLLKLLPEQDCDLLFESTFARSLGMLLCLVSVCFVFDSVFLCLAADKCSTGGAAGASVGALAAAKALSMLFEEEVKGDLAMGGSSDAGGEGDDGASLVLGSPFVGVAVVGDCFKAAEITMLGLRKKSFLGKMSLLVESDAGSSTYTQSNVLNCLFLAKFSIIVAI